MKSRIRMDKREKNWEQRDDLKDDYYGWESQFFTKGWEEYKRIYVRNKQTGQIIKKENAEPFMKEWIEEVFLENI